MKTKDRILYARQCDITKEGMNEHLREIEKNNNLEYDKDVAEGRLTDDFLLNDYYEAEYYYWTEWECESDLQYEEINGKLIELND
jgi:hypothetical protein